MPTKKPKVFVVHLGCAKNQVDAENLVGEMLHAGFATCDSAAKADYILVNTCGFIEAAKEESINAILAQAKAKKSKQKLIVSGCLSGRYGEELMKELPEVDFWVGTYKPGELLKKMGIVAPQNCDAENLPRMNLRGFPHHAYLKIAEGCNCECGYFASSASQCGVGVTLITSALLLLPMPQPSKIINNALLISLNYLVFFHFAVQNY